MPTTIKIVLPDEILLQARTFVDAGRASSLDDLVAESLRRFLESHTQSMTDQFIREDVNWGLTSLE